MQTHGFLNLPYWRPPRHLILKPLPGLARIVADALRRALKAVVEMDQERDRKTCLMLDRKVTGANRELAQWCLDHPRYGQRTIAEWLGCSQARIFHLRKWASSGFEGSPFDSQNKPDRRPRHDVVITPRNQSPLESLDNSESDDDTDDDDDSGIAAPEVLIDNIMHAIGGINENARI